MARDAWEQGQALAADRDHAGALAWLDRAHRIAPADQNILFALAWQHLRTGDAEGAAALFGTLAGRHSTRETFCGLIAASLAAGRISDAKEAAGTALSHVATDAALQTLAQRVVESAGLDGWCGFDEAGFLLAYPGAAGVQARMDGVLQKLRRMAPGRYRVENEATLAGVVEVRAGNAPLLGSPLAPGRIFRLEGFVERDRRGVRGWVWHPGAPGRKPVLMLADAEGRCLGRITASTPADNVESHVPLALPRRFFKAVPQDSVVRLLGPDGRDLLGSPVATHPSPPPPLALRRRRLSLDRPVDVVIPVFRGLGVSLACIDSVLETVAEKTRIWVVDDASPEPALVAALEAKAASGAIRLIRSGDGGRNRGFPAAANAGMRAAEGRHVVLLNSDTLVAHGWLERLRDAACSAADIGTATPLSNEASILSYPDEAGKNPAPELGRTRELARLAARANRGRLVEIPTAHGFCMFIRRDCLNQTGLFDENLFAQGYGEENDFSERARHLGWRHVAVPEVFVAHLGGVSFGAARDSLLRRNLQLLEQRHPGYMQRVDTWIAADPLFRARRRLDIARWKLREERPGAPPLDPRDLDGKEGAAMPPPCRPNNGSPGGLPLVGGRGGQSPPAFSRAFLLVTHGAGGGTARIVRERGVFWRKAGFRPIVLRAAGGFCEVDDGAGSFPNLRFSLPAEFEALRRLLATARPAGAELHHLLGHHHSVVDLFTALGISYDAWIHDYAWFCPRLSFITGEGRFCGEPEAVACETCVASWGRAIEEDISAAHLRLRSQADLRGARSVIVPSADVARRVARHVPGLIAVVRPWEADTPSRILSPEVGAMARMPVELTRRRGDKAVRRIAVVGAIGVDKGFEVLLACGKDAAARRLKLEFVVVGYTVDDEKLLETGCAFITGPFKSDEAATLIRAQGADLAFLPSIWPETWCYALSDAWAAGLPAAVFDIGTPPARVRAARRGWVLPLGLPASRVNDVLLSLALQISAPPRTDAFQPHPTETRAS